MTSNAYAVKLPKYQNEFADRAIELGKLGYTKAMIAAHFGVGEVQLNDWAGRKKGFKEALEVTMTASQAYHESKLLESYENKNANASLITQMLRANFSDKYKSSTDNTKKPAAQEPQIDFNAEIAKLIAELDAAGD